MISGTQTHLAKTDVTKSQVSKIDFKRSIFGRKICCQFITRLLSVAHILFWPLITPESEREQDRSYKCILIPHKKLKLEILMINRIFGTIRVVIRVVNLLDKANRNFLLSKISDFPRKILMKKSKRL